MGGLIIKGGVLCSVSGSGRLVMGSSSGVGFVMDITMLKQTTVSTKLL